MRASIEKKEGRPPEVASLGTSLSREGKAKFIVFVKPSLFCLFPLCRKGIQRGGNDELPFSDCLHRRNFSAGSHSFGLDRSRAFIRYRMSRINERMKELIHQIQLAKEMRKHHK